MRLLSELRRRNVLRMLVLYVVAAWLIVQVAGALIDLARLPAWIGTTTLWLLAIGFPIALIFSWFYEITPEGISLEKDFDPQDSITYATGRRLDFIVIAMLCAAVILFAYDKWWTGGPPQNSIAVLPFVNMSDDTANEYFSDGISEELLNLLAKIPELRVIARTSAFSYKGKNVSITKIAEELNVAYVLEGSVRRDGADVRITAQLIEARSNTHVFSETYDITLDNVFAVQDEIAEKIVGSLKVSLLNAAPKVKEVGSVAYELFLKGKFLAGWSEREKLEKGVDLLERSIRVDSGYAPAWDVLGAAYRNQSNYGYRDIDEGTAQARKAIERALALDPLLAGAWAMLGIINLSYDWEFDAADVAIQRALELGPNDYFVLGSAARLDTALGRFNEAITLRRKVLDIAPLSLYTRMMLGWDLLLDGQTAEAEVSLRELLELDDQYPIAHCLLGQVLLLQGKLDESLIEMNLESQEGWKQFGAALVLESLGRHDEVVSATNKFVEQYGQVWIYQTAVIYAYRNEVDAAFEWLDRGYEERDSGMVLLLGDPFLANIRDDPRWNILLDKMGLAR
jgi:adenylate cyclase